jgi:cytochrome c553
MKLTKAEIAVLAIIISFAAPLLASHAEDLAVRNCTWCHGASAEGYAPAPRLAGQRYQYIENQLKSFGSQRRDNPFSKMYMWSAAANLNRRTARDLAIYFSTLRPKAANDGNEELVALGRRIYQEGLPDSNIVACIACHGPAAQGVREIPRLGGLEYAYVQRRLEQWQEGYDRTARHPMPHVASKLSLNQIAALASYLSFMKE